jgi:hypothetical protein
MDLLDKHVGFSADMKILEVGRDAIPLTDRLSDPGTYLGIDINSKQIDWCIANITARHPNFRFEFWNVREDWYNPAGILPLSDCRTPEAPESVDLIILQSVFTHMLPDDIMHYLLQFQRILKPLSQAGLEEAAAPIFGSWSGPKLSGQDIAIMMRRPSG